MKQIDCPAQPSNSIPNAHIPGHPDITSFLCWEGTDCHKDGFYSIAHARVSQMRFPVMRHIYRQQLRMGPAKIRTSRYTRVIVKNITQIGKAWTKSRLDASFLS